MKTYFLSYARADQTLALRFADDLIGAGISVWVDQYDIEPSQHWDRAVETAVRACRGMLVMLSPRSVVSPNVADEVAVAINDAKDVIPILIERCTLPLRMTRMQFIDATTDYDGAVRRCLAHIRRASPADTPDAGPPDGAVAAPLLAADVVKTAERRLTGIVGPIAGVLVRTAAAKAKSEAELYRTLALGIADGAERESFLAWLTGPGEGGIGGAAAQPLAASDLERIKIALTRHLGPIAAHLIDRERATSSTTHELLQRLGARITSDKDRAAFLREAGG